MSFSPLFRSATPNDDVFLCQLFATTRPDLSLLPSEVAASLLDMQFRARSLGYAQQFPNLESLVIVGPSEPIGTLLLAETADTLRIVDIAILPAHRGQGVGTIAIQYALQRAAHREVRLRVQHGNPAERLYRRLGFQIISDEDIGIELSNKIGCPKGSATVAPEKPASKASRSRPKPFALRILREKRGVGGSPPSGSRRPPSFAQGILTVTPGPPPPSDRNS